jgi:hypothetical protein
MCNVRTLSGVIRRRVLKSSAWFIGGSLRIEPFEGRRPRLRRTRPVWQTAAMGYEYDFEALDRARERGTGQIRFEEKVF